MRRFPRSARLLCHAPVSTAPAIRRSGREVCAPRPGAGSSSAADAGACASRGSLASTARWTTLSRLWALPVPQLCLSDCFLGLQATIASHCDDVRYALLAATQLSLLLGSLIPLAHNRFVRRRNSSQLLASASASANPAHRPCWCGARRSPGLSSLRPSPCSHRLDAAHSSSYSWTIARTAQAIPAHTEGGPSSIAPLISCDPEPPPLRSSHTRLRPTMSSDKDSIDTYGDEEQLVRHAGRSWDDSP